MATLNYDQQNGIERAILTDNGKPQDCFFAPVKNPPQSGRVLMGKVDRVMPNGRGAFVNIGNGNGFLNGAEGLQAGDSLAVQIKSEAREQKGPGLTRSISLPGVYLIYQPDGEGLNFSRRMADGECDQAQQRVGSILAAHNGGWVLRRAAVNAAPDAVAAEAAELSNLAFDQGVTAPSAFEQAVLSAASAPGFKVVAEEGTGLPTSYLKAARPSLLASLNVTYVKNAFDQYDLEHFYAALRAPQLALQNGGSIIFERTQTLNVIDVNAGERTRFVEVNVDAAKLIMQHIKWRNIGGLITIDFLKTRQREDQQAVLNVLYDIAASDALPCDIYGFTRMGLCEISRARRGLSLAEIAA